MRKSLLTLNSGESILVDAADLSAEDRDKNFICEVCGARAYLNISRLPNKANWFSSNEHKPECPLAEGGRTFKTADGHVFHLADIMTHRDRPLKEPKEFPPESGGGERKGPEIGEIPEDNIMVEGPDHHRTGRTMFRAMREMRSDEHITEELTVADILVDERTIENARQDGLDGFRMIVLKRCAVGQIDPPLPKKKDWLYGYVNKNYIGKTTRARC